uniref:baseplate J/gp47 family protein n=1 Tax=Brachyspira catarrhinii TaxID=2528966 RepID=UPI003F4B3EAE
MNESLEQLKAKILNQYYSELNPLENTPKYNLVKVIANVEAGIQYSILGDIEFLKKQIFPDTAEKDFLRAHWADRVPPLYAEVASGSILIEGIPGVSIPAGCVFSSNIGNTYFNSKSYIIENDGSIEIEVQAQNAGSSYNLKKDSKLSLTSNLISNVSSEAVVKKDIEGGTDGETDENYLLRVLNYVKSSLNGKSGDFAAWALNASSEVSKAWEFKNFNIFGALLIVVLGGNSETGFYKISNIERIQTYIENVAPPIIFTVKALDLIYINLTIDLLPLEDTMINRKYCENTIKEYFLEKAKPDMFINTSTLRDLIVDGVSISNASVTIEDGDKYISQLQFPVLGSILWV